MVEILSPAGSIEHLRSAVFGGANGVYLGTKEFSARQNAENFTFPQLEEAVSFCHLRGVNVYVAVNTVVKNGELSELKSLALKLSEINVDGVIVQDLATAEIFRQISPSLSLHASTQMAIHNLSGAKFLKSQGFSRIVLARELTFEEIKKITAECGTETEVFVHGAHCMSVSGMCYLSSFIGGRSGNRGRCAQPCRLDFKINGEKNCLSLKDMCYIEYVSRLKEMGVTSLKIEGRMKRPEYAYISAKTYKKALNGESFDGEMKLLRGIFSRSGFTDGYISGKRNVSMFGYRSKEDVEAGQNAIKEIGKIEETEKIPINARFEVWENSPARLTFFKGDTNVSVCSTEVITNNTRLPTAERIKESVCKTGGTPFEVKSCDVVIEGDFGEGENVFSISSVNSLRRNGIEELSALLSSRPKKEIKEYSLPKASGKKRECNEIRIRLEKASQGDEISGFKGKIIIPIDEAKKLPLTFDKKQIILEIPSLVYPFEEETLIKKLSNLFEEGYKNALCENISFVQVLTKMGFNLFGGGYMNVYNPIAFSQYEKIGVTDITLSPEINSGELYYFDSGKTGVITYGYLPLMHFRLCPAKVRIGCGKCKGESYLTDRLNNKFPLLCRGEYSALLNTVPVAVNGKKLCVDFQTLYFTKETSKEVCEILKAFENEREFDFPHTKGLYFRKVL